MSNYYNSEQKEQSPLERFCRNLTEEARSGKLDPVIGRKFGDGDGSTTFNLPNYMNITSGAVYLIKYK